MYFYEVIYGKKVNFFYNIRRRISDFNDALFFIQLRKSILTARLFPFDSDNKGIGIVESGSACVVDILPNGSRTILENLNEGDIFARTFIFMFPKTLLLLKPLIHV